MLTIPISHFKQASVAQRSEAYPGLSSPIAPDPGAACGLTRLRSEKQGSEYIFRRLNEPKKHTLIPVFSCLHMSRDDHMKCDLKKYLLPFFFLFSFGAMAVQPAPLETGAIKAPAQVIPLSKQQNQSNEVEVLRAQLDANKEYQESLLETVYWALGGVFVIVGLLLGFGWFVNFRVYERDKESLRREVEALLAKESALLSGQISAQAIEAQESIQKNVSSEIKKISSLVGSVEKKLNTHVFNMEFRDEKKLMLNNTSPSMALTGSIKVLRLSIEGKESEIPDILHFMIKKIDEGGKFTAEEITRLNGHLSSLPTQYGTLVDKLRGKLIASDIF